MAFYVIKKKYFFLSFVITSWQTRVFSWVKVWHRSISVN